MGEVIFAGMDRLDFCLEGRHLGHLHGIVKGCEDGGGEDTELR